MTNLESIGYDLACIEDILTELIQPIINPDPLPPKHPKIIMPRASRCSMLSAQQSRPCKAPAIYPMGLCPSHFRHLFGHLYEPWNTVLRQAPGWERKCTCCGAEDSYEELRVVCNGRQLSSEALDILVSNANVYADYLERKNSKDKTNDTTTD